MARPSKKKQALSVLGGGLYTVSEAARLLQLEARAVRRWVAGYDFYGRSGATRFSEPLFKRSLEPVGGLVELTFRDLVELLFIKHFLGSGVSMYVIRKTAEAAAQMFGVESHPFFLKRFKTDGQTIYAVMQLEEAEVQPEEMYLLDIHKRQHALMDIVAPFFLQFDYAVDSDTVQRWWPMGRERQVMVDPEVSRGAPVLASSGVPTLALAEFAKAGRKVEVIADWYEISPGAVQDALEFEHRHEAA